MRVLFRRETCVPDLLLLYPWGGNLGNLLAVEGVIRSSPTPKLVNVVDTRSLGGPREPNLVILKSRAPNRIFRKYIWWSNTFTFAMIPGLGRFNSIRSTGPSVWNSPKLPPRFILSIGISPTCQLPCFSCFSGKWKCVGRGRDWRHTQQVE